MTDIMLDIETLGTHPGCVILSIGAAVFDLKGDGCADTFYVNIDRQNAEQSGLRVEPDTAAWWEKRSESARAALLVDPQPTSKALIAFGAWFQRAGDARLWCHGANFDEPILGYAYWRLDMPTPWKFWNTRCTRTLYDLADVNTMKIPNYGTKHNALDDVRFQVKCVQACYRRIHKLPPLIPQPEEDTGVFS